jgi:hypothetical protein
MIALSFEPVELAVGADIAGVLDTGRAHGSAKCF